MASGEMVEITATDGTRLAGTHFGNGHEEDVVIVNAAMAVPARFYRSFAEGLAEMGLGVITWDYRDVGESLRRPIGESNATLEDWALRDMSGVVGWAHANMAPRRLFMVGHSLGGQLAGLIECPEVVSAMVTVSAQSGHWRLQGAEQKLLVALHGYVTLPLASRVYGYTPWSKFAAGVDVPAEVGRRWAEWIRHPDYLLGDESLPLDRFDAFTAPVLAYSFSDDKWGTAAAVDALMLRAYPTVERRHVNPTDHGLDQIGHTGFFRPAAAALWSEASQWLRGH